MDKVKGMIPIRMLIHDHINWTLVSHIEYQLTRYQDTGDYDTEFGVAIKFTNVWENGHYIEDYLITEDQLNKKDKVNPYRIQYFFILREKSRVIADTATMNKIFEKLNKNNNLTGPVHGLCDMFYFSIKEELYEG